VIGRQHKCRTKEKIKYGSVCTAKGLSATNTEGFTTVRAKELKINEFSFKKN